MGRTWIVLACFWLAACSTPPPTASDHDGVNGSAWAEQSRLEPNGRWQHQTFRNRHPTTYRAGVHQSRPALHAQSDSGNSVLRQRVQIPVGSLGTLRFSWWVNQLNTAFDLTDREHDDAVARVILTFDGDRQAWTTRDHMLSELAHMVTGEPLPDATLMYVWDHAHPVGTVLRHPTTNRIRKLVVVSGPEALGRWVEVERDVRADLQQVFGEGLQRLSGVGLMTDANNSRQTAEAWYGPVRLDLWR